MNNDKDFRPRQASTMDTCMAARPPVAQILRDRAERLRREAHNLDALAFVAGQLTGEAEEGLFLLACKA